MTNTETTVFDVRVIPRAKQNIVKDGDPGAARRSLRVYTTVAPADGKANEAVIKLLAHHFGVSKSSVRILRGQTARDKTVEIVI